MIRNPINILFNTWANADNLNSQSLTAREIALRLDPARFVAKLFIVSDQTADPRLVNQPHIRLVRIPPRLGSLAIAREMLWGHQDILFYPSLNARASRIFWGLKRLGFSQSVIENVEVSWAQIQSAPPAAQKLLLKSIHRADRCFAIAPVIAQSLQTECGINAEVIPLGVDLKVFKPVDRRDHNMPVRVLFVATIQPRKQPHLILNLARVLRDMPVEFHFIGPILGDPAYYHQLLADKERDNLQNVIFHGGLVQKEIVEWMTPSDIFVLPSRLEGFGKVMIEAGATGLPSIIFDDYQSPTVVDGVTGFQVKTFDEMLAKLKLLIEHREVRWQMGRAAVEHAKQFDWDIVAKKWEQVFEKVAQYE